MQLILEHEQANRIRLVRLITLLVASLIVISGLTIWWVYASREKIRLIGSQKYSLLVEKIAQNNWKNLKNDSKDLIKNYTKSPYSQLTGLEMAKLAINANSLHEAKNYLFSISQIAQDPLLNELTHLRLARILLSMHQPQLALEAINKKPFTAFQSLQEEVKGDILMALGQFENAKQAYQRGLRLYTQAEFSNPILVMKMNEVTVSLDTID